MADFETIQKIQEIIEGLIAHMGVSARVSPEDSLSKGLIFNISSPDSRLLIGKNGIHLQAMQSLTQAIAGKLIKPESPVFFTLDVDEYKKKREWFIKEAVKHAVERVKTTGRSVALEPMPPTERRFVHTYIQETYSEIESSSEGLEPYRKVVLNLKKLQ